jgi:hypothetical protein
MEPFADIDDFVDRHGEFEDEGESTIVETLLKDASNLIRDTVAASTEEWVSDETPTPPESVVEITVAVAYRAWSNPDALARTEVGDTSAYYQSGTGADALYLSSAQKRRLRRAAGLKGRRFRSVQLSSPYFPDDAEDDE